MPHIPFPHLTPGDPDRGTECEARLEPAFAQMADAAVAAGWSEDEVEAALIGLARARIFLRIERESAAKAVERIRRAAGWAPRKATA